MKTCKFCKFYGTKEMTIILSGFYEEEECKFLKPVCKFYKEIKVGRPTLRDADDDHSCENYGHI